MVIFISNICIHSQYFSKTFKKLTTNVDTFVLFLLISGLSSLKMVHFKITAKIMYYSSKKKLIILRLL